MTARPAQPRRRPRGRRRRRARPGRRRDHRPRLHLRGDRRAVDAAGQPPGLASASGPATTWRSTRRTGSSGSTRSTAASRRGPCRSTSTTSTSTTSWPTSTTTPTAWRRSWPPSTSTAVAGARPADAGARHRPRRGVRRRAGRGLDRTARRPVARRPLRALHRRHDRQPQGRRVAQRGPHPGGAQRAPVRRADRLGRAAGRRGRGQRGARWCCSPAAR